MKYRYPMILCCLGLLSQVALAVPTIYPTELTKLSSIKNSTNSNLVADSDDLNVFWVMPPNSAASQVGHLHTITSNIGFCQEMSDLQNYSRSTVARMNDLMHKEIDSKKDLDIKNAELSEARNDLAEHISTNNLGELERIDQRVDTIEIELRALTDKLLSCKQYCHEVRGQIQALKSEKMQEVSRRRNLFAEFATVARNYERKKSRITGLEADVVSLEETWANLSKKLMSLRSQFIEMYSSFGRMEGARASISYESNWDKNIEILRSENPSVAFQKINTQNAVITTSIADFKDIPTNGAILGYNIAGTYGEGKLSLTSYPDNLAGNVRLSLLGACPALHPELFNINLPNGTDQMKYGMTISYEYPTAFALKATAKYNMYKMYSKIAKSGSSGGFFWSKSWSSIEERTYFRDSFVVDWKEQDAGNSISDQEKAEYEKEWRANILGRLAVLGLPSVSNPGQLVLPSIPASGMVVLGNSLANNKFCNLNPYCSAATIGVNVLAAIFGGSQSSASYTNIQDVEMEERWSREKVIYKPWITSYR